MKTLILLFAVSLAACGPALQEANFEQSLNETFNDPFAGEEPPPEEIPEALNPEAPEVSEAAPWVSFKMNPSSATLAHGPANFWEGCEVRQTIKGGYSSDSVCGRAYFHPRFAQELNKHFYKCVDQAALTAKINKPSRVFINHFGSYNNRSARGSSRLSMHAYARALDIVNFNLYDANGVFTKISTHVRDYKGQTAVFYDKFRACWKASMPAGCSGQTEGSGSIGHPESDQGGNTLHNDHIHLSLPLCAR